MLNTGIDQVLQLLSVIDRLPLEFFFLACNAKRNQKADDNGDTQEEGYENLKVQTPFYKCSKVNMSLRKSTLYTYPFILYTN